MQGHNVNHNGDIELGSLSTTSPKSNPQASSLPKGFSAVACKIACNPDKTTTIYRRFDRLSAQNLLFYQAELAELEKQQNEYDEADRNAKDPVSIECQRDWSEFARSAEKKRTREEKKMELAMTIRDKLEKYHNALAAHQVLLNSRPPSHGTVIAMKNWFFDNKTGTKDGDRIPQLWGASEAIYNDLDDLVALRVPVDQDRLSYFIQNNFGLFFKTSLSDSNQTYVSERMLSHFIAILSTILACTLLFGAIISMYIVQNKQALLGLLSGWTVLFAACVGLLTNAKRDQIFAATAAYAAVLVVFVSGNLSGATETGNYVNTQR